MNKKTLETNFPGVYVVGDVNGVGTPKAGVFVEGAARVVAAAIIAQLRGGPLPEAYKGVGSCYVEFGHDQVGRVDMDFLSGPKPTGTYQEPSGALVREEEGGGGGKSAEDIGRRSDNFGLGNLQERENGCPRWSLEAPNVENPTGLCAPRLSGVC